ncbi:MAG: histidine phosphatase family protein [Candidatus Binatia bacterium]|nr:histidine phosphatase family protein [Candidatus Binatia bacterium]
MQPFPGRGRLFLLRHGETEWNRARRVMGRRPVPLCDEGRAQLELLTPHLPGLGISCIWTSPMVRARQTAEIASAAVGGVPIREDDGLAEVDYADWEGCGFEELLADPGYHEFHKDPLRSRVPGGGETLFEVRERVFDAAARALAETTDGHPLLVSHGDPLRLVLAACMATPPTEFRRLRVDNGALSAIDLTGTWSEAKFVNMRPDLGVMLDAEMDGARALREGEAEPTESK